MRQLIHIESVALLARGDIIQAAFARLDSITVQQVNIWARGHAAVPQWAALLAIALLDLSAKELAIPLEKVPFSWDEVLGVSATAKCNQLTAGMDWLGRLLPPK